MLREIHPRAHTRYTSLSLLGPYLDGFVGWLWDQGYPLLPILRRIQAAARLNALLSEHGVRHLGELTVSQLMGFRPASSQDDVYLTALVRSLAAYSVEERLLAPPVSTAADRLVSAYGSELEDVRGFADSTVHHHLATVVEFLSHLRYDGTLCANMRETADQLEISVEGEREGRHDAEEEEFDGGASAGAPGGAFKTLVHGRSPRDLDVWAPSNEDRRQLTSALQLNGAVAEPSTEYADVFRVDDRVIEIPFRCDRNSLEQVIRRFDIGLSAIGVEISPTGARAFVHPLAHESLLSRQVLLLKPLANWMHCLASLHRLRRYAVELGFTVPRSEEEEIWRTFANQDFAMRRGMLERLDKVGLSNTSVGREARRLLPGWS